MGRVLSLSEWMGGVALFFFSVILSTSMGVGGCLVWLLWV